MMRLSIWLTMLMATSASAWVPADFAKRTSPEAGGATALYYRLWTPVGYTAATKYPLVIFLHGSGERGNQGENDLQMRDNGQFTFLSTANQAAYPMFYALPQATWTGWSDGQLDQVIAMIDDLRGDFHIDPDRIYITGISMGGAGTWSIIHRNPGVFAAAVPQSGWGPGGDAAPLASLPLWDFHALNDGTVPVAGSQDAIGWLRNAGGDPIYTQFDTGDHSGTWPAAYAMPALIPWLMAQKHGQARAGNPRVDITTPTKNRIWQGNGASLALGGTASASAKGIAWYVGATTGAATGTTAWTATATGLAGTPWVRMQATEPSGSALNGNTTYSDSLKVVTSATGDATPPTITIQQPTTAATYTATAGTVTLSGIAADNKAVSKVRWTSDRGGGTDATGTAAWSAATITVHAGANVITVTAVDSSGLETSANITVYSVGTTPPSPDMSTAAMPDLAGAPPTADMSVANATDASVAAPDLAGTGGTGGQGGTAGSGGTAGTGGTAGSGGTGASSQGCTMTAHETAPPSLWLLAGLIAVVATRRRTRT